MFDLNPWGLFAVALGMRRRTFVRVSFLHVHILKHLEEIIRLWIDGLGREACLLDLVMLNWCLGNLNSVHRILSG